jgi:hypothetical protein
MTASRRRGLAQRRRVDMPIFITGFIGSAVRQ